MWPDGHDGELLQLLRGYQSDGLEGRIQLWICRAGRSEGLVAGMLLLW